MGGISLPTLLVAGIGELVVTRETGAMLVAYGIGSCVALAAWDPASKVAGLAHFMLPSGTAGDGGPVKFVDGGLELFLGAFESRGGRPARATFKAAGGASMLSAIAGSLEIGRRNAESVVAGLAQQGIALAATDFGGRAGRTVQLEAGTGRLLVQSIASAIVL